jgi:hypothetical protein
MAQVRKIGQMQPTPVSNLPHGTLFIWTTRYGVVDTHNPGAIIGVLFDDFGGRYITQDCLVVPLPKGTEITLVQE